MCGGVGWRSTTAPSLIEDAQEQGRGEVRKRMRQVMDRPMERGPRQTPSIMSVLWREMATGSRGRLKNRLNWWEPYAHIRVSLAGTSRGEVQH